MDHLNLIAALAGDAVARRNLLGLDQEICLNHIGKAYVALGELRMAVETFQKAGAVMPELSKEMKFNLGMANFWNKEDDVNGLFLSVLMQIQLMPVSNMSFNVMQCAAFAHWVIGDGRGVLLMLAKAKQELIEKQQQSYSCWR